MLINLASQRKQTNSLKDPNYQILEIILKENKNLNKPLSIEEIEFIVKTLTTGNFMSAWLHWWVQEGIVTIIRELFNRREEAEILVSLDQYYPQSVTLTRKIKTADQYSWQIQTEMLNKILANRIQQCMQGVIHHD